MSLAHSPLRTTQLPLTSDPDDVLVEGVSVRRVNFSEGRLSVAAVNRRAGIVVLRREGASAWVNRAEGAKYSPAVHMVCRFWVKPVEGSNRQETWCEELCSAPIRKLGGIM